MSFIFNKCRLMKSNMAKMITTEGVDLLEGNIAYCSGQLQIPWSPTGKWKWWGNCKEVSHSQTYIQRVRQVLKRHLNGQKKTWAINTYVLPVMRYSAGIKTLSKEETETRKFPTMHGGFTPGPAHKDCTQSRQETKDKWASEPLYKLKQLRSRNTSPLMTGYVNTKGSRDPVMRRKNHHGRKSPCMTCTTEDAGKHSLHGALSPSSWHSVQKHLHQVWAGSPRIIYF